VTRMPPLSAGAAGGTAGRAALSALGERGAGVPDTADGSGLGEVAVAGCGTGAAGDGGGGVGGIFLVVSPRALSAPSVVERVESAVESLLAAAAGAAPPLIDL